MTKKNIVVVKCDVCCEVQAVVGVDEFDVD